LPPRLVEDPAIDVGPLRGRPVDAGATLDAVILRYGWRPDRVTHPFAYDWEFSKRVDERKLSSSPR
jgi:hypothetical protein